MKRLFLFLFLGSASLLSTWSQPVINRIYQPLDTVGLYEKLELFLNFDADFTNPFDPEELDIMATFVSPSGEDVEGPRVLHRGRLELL